ncbi:hypothetical protein POTOM_040749 [Populus tomentosa]|uniref:Uncharacterized protein n=1 Tax=Populus tomentosa TaxID=118781 RepID=A0A8X8CIM2_POPTO|nr:hypothetical protein POTOM_040749 [Populus tomentosa]
MVAGKVRLAMGLQKSPANKTETRNNTPPPKPPLPSPSSGKASSQKGSFSRSFGVYFPRSSAQVQPRPPDVAEVLKLVEELRERESLLKTELLEFKLLKESVAIIPVLETEVTNKNLEIEKAVKKIESLELENECLKADLSEVRGRFEEERKEGERKVNELEAEIQELKKAMSDRENEIEFSSSQRFQGLMEVTTKSNLIRSLKKGVKCTDIVSSSSQIQNVDHHSKRMEENVEIEKPRHSRCNSEELTESTLANLRSRVPRVPKPPPKRSLSSPATSLPSVSPTGSDQSVSGPPVPPPPPPPNPPAKKVAPPPPPPPPKGRRVGVEKVRRVPEVVEFYHSLMRKNSRRECGGGMAETLPASANARDMIGEIENRSTHLLAVSTEFPFFQVSEIFTRFATGVIADRLERGVYNLSKMRESATMRYKGFQIPTDWMLETGIVSQCANASIILCQFAGGFDTETMRAFQELRDKARSCHVQCQNQQQQKLVCRSTPC